MISVCPYVVAFTCTWGTCSSLPHAKPKLGWLGCGVGCGVGAGVGWGGVGGWLGVGALALRS